MVLRGSFSWRAGGNGKKKEIVVETKASLEAISLRRRGRVFKRHQEHCLHLAGRIRALKTSNNTI